jgi:hypothetical protein
MRRWGAQWRWRSRGRTRLCLDRTVAANWALNGCGFTGGCSTAAVVTPSAPPASPAPSFRLRRTGRLRGWLFFSRNQGFRFGFFCYEWLEGNSGVDRRGDVFFHGHKNWSRRVRRFFRRRIGDRSAQTRERFFRFRLPLRSTEPLGRGCVPSRRFGMFARFLLPLSQFKGDHGIASVFVKLRKLCSRVRARLGLADARLNLSPISHCRAL